MTDLTIPEAADVLRQWRVDTHRHTLDQIATAVDVLTKAIPSPDLPPWNLVTTHVSFTLHANDGTERTTRFSAVEALFELETQEVDGVPMTRAKITTDWRPTNG